MAKIPQFSDFALKIQAWQDSTAQAQSIASPSERPWCTLDLKETLTEENITKHFDRKPINEEFEKEYKKLTNAGPPFAWLQVEADMIYSMHRCFTTRHRNRMMIYRDDCAQKGFHTYGSISLGLAKYTQAKLDAEKLSSKGK